ncbi:MAG: exopolyphosphatase, partial [Acidobacteria bacterium]|nr:exopolyphosphatase [Acidobacteriota bacterium]
MKRLGIVDLGSNTARLVVYAYEPGVWYRLEDEIREPVRLAEGFGAGNHLAEAAVDRSAAAVKLMADFAQATGLGRLEVIATSAVRDADN